TTLRTLADDIDAMRHQIRLMDATIILLQAELDTLRRENGLLRSGIDPDVAVAEFMALGMNIRTVGERAAADLAGAAHPIPRGNMPPRLGRSRCCALQYPR